MTDKPFTPEEQKVMDALVAAYNAHAELEKVHPSHGQEFTFHIHALQRILMERSMGRLYPDYFTAGQKERQLGLPDTSRAPVLQYGLWVDMLSELDLELGALIKHYWNIRYQENQPKVETIIQRDTQFCRILLKGKGDFNYHYEIAYGRGLFELMYHETGQSKATNLYAAPFDPPVNLAKVKEIVKEHFIANVIRVLYT